MQLVVHDPPDLHARLKVLREDYDMLVARLTAAERRAEEAELQLRRAYKENKEAGDSYHEMRIACMQSGWTAEGKPEDWMHRQFEQLHEFRQAPSRLAAIEKAAQALCEKLKAVEATDEMEQFRFLPWGEERLDLEHALGRKPRATQI
jgi:hypothetical protein